VWPYVTLEGPTWPYCRGTARSRGTPRDPARPCMAPDGTGTCPNLSNARLLTSSKRHRVSVVPFSVTQVPSCADSRDVAEHPILPLVFTRSWPSWKLPLASLLAPCAMARRPEHLSATIDQGYLVARETVSRFRSGLARWGHGTRTAPKTRNLMQVVVQHGARTRDSVHRSLLSMPYAPATSRTPS